MNLDHLTLFLSGLLDLAHNGEGSSVTWLSSSHSAAALGVLPLPMAFSSSSTGLQQEFLNTVCFIICYFLCLVVLAKW